MIPIKWRALVIVTLTIARIFAQAPALPAPPPGPAGNLSAGVTLPPAPKRISPLEKLTPVTDAALIKPSPGDWLSWRRTYDDLGFSPLNQINKRNVGDLRVAWA